MSPHWSVFLFSSCSISIPPSQSVIQCNVDGKGGSSWTTGSQRPDGKESTRALWEYEWALGICSFVKIQMLFAQLSVDAHSYTDGRGSVNAHLIWETHIHTHTCCGWCWSPLHCCFYANMRSSYPSKLLVRPAVLQRTLDGAKSERVQQ